MRRYLCEICGKPAIYHETAIDESQVSQHHFCERHGDRVWLDAVTTFNEEEAIDDFKTMLVDELEHDSDLIESDLNKDEVREGIKNAQTLEELFAVLRRR